MKERKGRSGANAFWMELSAEYVRYQAAVRVIPMAHVRLQDDLRRYLCLRCAGFLEQVTYTIFVEFLEKKASAPVLEFSKSYFFRTPNLRANSFLELVRRFGSHYADRFDELLSEGGRRDTLNDLLEVRNDVAHGKYHSGRKLNPDRYIKLCEDIYDWLVSTYLDASGEDELPNRPTRARTKRGVKPA